MKPKIILKHLLVWQVLIIVVVSISSILPLRASDTFLGGGITNYLKNPLLNFRSNFDGVHYILISTHGYNYGQQAFFPLYSQLIHWVDQFTHAPIFSGTLISTVCFFLALLVLDKLIRLDYPSPTPRWVLLILLLFPVSFFFTAVYTESLFLFLTVSAFYFARKKYWLLAGLCGFFASYTRFIGIFLFPALLIEFLQYSSKPKIIKIIPLLLIPLGLTIYMMYLQQTTGDPFAFYHLQKLFNQNRSMQIVLPYQVIWRYIKMVFTVNRTDPLYLTIWLEFVSGVMFLILSAISLFTQRLSYALFNLCAYLIPTLTGNFVSVPRYVLICFPVFMLLGNFFSHRPRLGYIYLVISFSLMTIFLSMFARGYWVA
jgi:Gpi18-like mannosyltransferase